MKRFLFALPIFTCLTLVPAFAAWPAYFVPNVGQWEGEFAYRCDVGNASYWITSSGFTLAVYAKDESRGMKDEARRSLQCRVGFSDKMETEDGPIVVRGHALMMHFVEANPCFELVPDEPLTSYSNYFKGRDSCQWHGRVPNYQRVIAKEVWPGIDVEYKADQRGVETVFRVQPGADVSRIIIEYDGIDAPLRLDGQGNLVLITSVGELHEQAPFAFQNEGRVQKSVPVRYAILNDNRYGFACENFDMAEELVIDPLVYSTFFAGSDLDKVSDMAMDSQGNKIVCGWMHPMREDFPVSPGAFQTERVGNPSWIAKLTLGADSIIFATYVSGPRGVDAGGSVLVDASDCIYHINYVSPPNWPITSDAFDTTAGNGDVGIIRLSSDGSTLQYGSYLGGEGSDQPWGGKLDSLGRLYLYGTVYPPNSEFPIVQGALFPEAETSCGFIAIFNPSISALVYSTFFFPAHASSYTLTYISDISIISESMVWVCGNGDTTAIITTPDALLSGPRPPGRNSLAYFSLLDLEAGQIVYSSYFYGPDGRGFSTNPIRLHGIDSMRVVLCGSTNEPGIPLPPGGFQNEYFGQGAPEVFLVEVERPQTLICGTFLEGTDFGATHPIALHIAADGSAVLLGRTNHADFPVTPDAYDTTFNGSAPATDAVLVRLSADMSELLYGTYIGGSSDEAPIQLIYESTNSVWIAGETESGNYPVTADALYPWAPGGFITCLNVPGEQSPIEPRFPAPQSLAFSSYPNPFNPTTTLIYSLPHPSRVILDVFNTLGQHVKRVDIGRVSAGDNRFLFTANDLPSGAYFARLNTGEFSQTRKMVMVK